MKHRSICLSNSAHPQASAYLIVLIHKQRHKQTEADYSHGSDSTCRGYEIHISALKISLGPHLHVDIMMSILGLCPHGIVPGLYTKGFITMNKMFVLYTHDSPNFQLMWAYCSHKQHQKVTTVLLGGRLQNLWELIVKYSFMIWQKVTTVLLG